MKPEAPTNPTPASNPVPAATPAVAPSNAWMGGWAAVQLAADRISKNWQPAAVYVGVSFVLALLAYITGFGAHAKDAHAGAADGPGLVALLLALAGVRYGLAIADNKPMTVADFLKVDISRWLTLIVAAIIAGVALLIAAIPILIPWIWVLPWVAFTGYAVVDKSLGPVAAISESKRLATDNKGKVWGLIGWFVLVSIAAGIIGIIPLVKYILQPAISVLELGSMALLYRWLQKNVSAPAPAAPAPQAPVAPAA